MWVEQLPNGKYKYFERYKDTYTEKRYSVSAVFNAYIIGRKPIK